MKTVLRMRVVKGLWLSVATLSREHAEDGSPVAARDVLSVLLSNGGAWAFNNGRQRRANSKEPSG